MRKLFLLCVAILLVGCTVPGAYMDTYNGVAHSSSLKGRLLSATLIPLDADSLRAGLIPDLNAPYAYHIGPYDVLSVIVWGHPELSSITSTQNFGSISANSNSLLQNTQNLGFSQLTQQQSSIFVDADGKIVFPLIGEIKVSGLTVSEIRKLLACKLTRYIRNPQVSVQVIAFNSQRVHVVGELMQPGMRPLADRPLTILDAINLCGGISINSADPRHIYVIRQNNEHSISVFWLNAKSPQTLLLAERFRLANNDIVYVAPAGVVSWNRIVSQILPTVETIMYTDSLIRNIR
jgi:polysaccharide biosynthesis/export protein